MKQCTKCRELKNEKEFFKNKKQKDGIQDRCKACEKIRLSIYYSNKKKSISEQKKEYYRKNIERIKIKNKKYYNKKRLELLQQKKKYYKNNRVKLLIYKKEYWQRPETKKRVMVKREEINETRRRYNKNHPELIKEIKRRRRAKKKQLIESFSQKEWEEKLEATKGICRICGKPYDEVYPFVATLDHTPPISKAPVGFCYTIDDITPMCGLCNLFKGSN